GLPVDRRPHAHEVLAEMGFRPRRRWLYMTGKPANRVARVADVIDETRPDYWVLSVLHCGEPIAEAHVELGRGGKGVVRWIAVAEAFQGRGLGRALFDQATGLLASRGADEVVLYVVDDGQQDGAHARALSLYAGAGFAVTDRLVGFERAG
ncbi:MAG TPA: GNAT family N-acetyltransferase, partial [Candidatus Eisenbacteria bacterium]|nr:GNAT family N-acetyltransferase [Candidatus Eisenbacteria bacterium]